MIVACSAFVNLLIVKAEQAGVLGSIQAQRSYMDTALESGALG